MAALTVWAERLNNSRILFLTDNIALVRIINNCSCKDRQIRCLVRRMMLVSMKFNIHFKEPNMFAAVITVWPIPFLDCRCRRFTGWRRGQTRRPPFCPRQSCPKIWHYSLNTLVGRAMTQSLGIQTGLR